MTLFRIQTYEELVRNTFDMKLIYNFGNDDIIGAMWSKNGVDTVVRLTINMFEKLDKWERTAFIGGLDWMKPNDDYDIEIDIYSLEYLKKFIRIIHVVTDCEEIIYDKKSWESFFNE